MNNSTNKSFFISSPDSLRLETPIKDRFKVLLNRIGRSQNWLADQIGISRGTMSKIVNGQWYPASQIMVRISQILECDSSALFGDSPLWKLFQDKIVYEEKKK